MNVAGIEPLDNFANTIFSHQKYRNDLAQSTSGGRGELQKQPDSVELLLPPRRMIRPEFDAQILRPLGLWRSPAVAPNNGMICD
jgi:hypothetical protein